MTSDNLNPNPPAPPASGGAPAVLDQAASRPASPTKTRNVIGLVSIILAVVGFALAIIPLLGIVGWPLLVAALVLGIVGLTRKGQSKATSIAGLVLSVLAMILAPIIAIAILAGSANAASSVISDDTDAPAAVEEQPAADEAAAEEPAAEEPAEPAVPAEYASALTKAEMYSSMMYMSKQGVYDQLTSEYGEKFSAEAGQYAIDNVQADWNANALAKAKTYQETMSMSPDAIRDQLVSEYGEKFTAEEADYAIAHLND